MSTDPRDPQPHDGTQQQPQDGGTGQPQPGPQGPNSPVTGAQPPPYPQDAHPHNPYANRPSTPEAQATPSRPMTPTEERNFALFAHLASGIALVLTSGALGWAAALVFYLVFQDRGPFVRHHAANALNVQILVGIVVLISVPLVLLLGLGLLTGFFAIVFGVILSIMGAIKANNGEWWTPPLTPAFVK